MLFLDTEFFESRRGPRLLSIGIVSPASEFYAELDESSLARMAGIRKNRFLQRTVLSQFRRIADAQTTLVEMAHKTALWLRVQGSESFQVAYDYSMDFKLLADLLMLADPAVLAKLQPIHVGYLLEDPDGIAAADAAWSTAESLHGLTRHHALADAFALRARFEAVHST